MVGDTESAARRAAARNIVSGNNAVGHPARRRHATGNLSRATTSASTPRGSAAIGNTGSGVAFGDGANGNTIGGAAAGDGNLISGNGNMGVTLFGAGVNNNIVAGNRIGTDDFATTSIPNGFHGVNISDGAGNVIGGGGSARNVISGNLQSGVAISGATATGNQVLGNLIGTNGSGMSGIPQQQSRRGDQQRARQHHRRGRGGQRHLRQHPERHLRLRAPSAGTQIVANWIGSNFQATGAIGNVADGIRIDGAPSTVIGGALAGLRNIIGGNGQSGIGIYSGAARHRHPRQHHRLQRAAGVLGNAVDGIRIWSGSNTIIGGAHGRRGQSDLAQRRQRRERARRHRQPDPDRTNLRQRRPRASIWATTASPRTTRVMATTGPNNRQNFPVLAGVDWRRGGLAEQQAVTGHVHDPVLRQRRLRPSQHGEGQTFLGAVSVSTDAYGNATLPLLAAAAGQIVTATATSSGNDMSEFSACVTVPAAPPAANLFLTMTESADPVGFGAPYSYSLLVHNDGPGPSHQRDGQRYAGGRARPIGPPCRAGQCTVVDRTVTCALGALGAVRRRR